LAENSVLHAVIGQARRRAVLNEAFSRFIGTLNACLTGVILLLFLGTELLDARWVLGLAGASVLVGVWLVWRRVPTGYAVAQWVDHRLALEDSLSTAYYYSRLAPAARDSGEVTHAQRLRAEKLAQDVEPRRAVPLTLPRNLYLCGGLLLFASSLSALRYGIEKRLDLRNPLARIVIGAISGEVVERAASAKKPDSQTKASLDETTGAGQDQNQRIPPDAADKTMEGLEKINAPGPDGDQLIPKSDLMRDGFQEGESEGLEEGTEMEASSDKASRGDGGTGEQGKESSKSKKMPEFPNQDSSLMAKFRDALADLMSRVKQSPSSRGTERPSNKQEGDKQGQNRQPGPGDKGSPSPGEQGQIDPMAQAEQGDTGAEGADKDGPESSGKGKSSGQKESRAPGSGIGKEDGDKSKREAAQLEAMGKISEILGKRANNIAGEITVEVHSGKQQLRTPYSDRGTLHIEAGGGVNRDEVPIIYQRYVQQYFEQVRKAGQDPKGP